MKTDRRVPVGPKSLAFAVAILIAAGGLLQAAGDAKTKVEPINKLDARALAAKIDEAEFLETAAEKRRREAALGVGGDGADDSDDDDTPRVPPPVAQSRGIRFAQSPVRGKR